MAHELRVDYIEKHYVDRVLFGDKPAGPNFQLSYSGGGAGGNGGDPHEEPSQN